MNKDHYDDLRKKAEEHNEELLKNTAFTFSLEGVSRDVKSFIQKKISFTNHCLKNVTEMLSSLFESNVTWRKSVLSKEGEKILTDMLKHLHREMEITNMALNLIIQNAMKREDALNKDRENTDAGHPKERDDE